MLPPRAGFMSGTAAGLLISSAMWSAASISTVTYYRRFGSDPLYLKLSVGFIWILFTAFIVLEAIGFNQLINSGGLSDIFAPLPMSIASIIECVMQGTVQAIYAIRIYRFWKKIYIPLFCWICALVVTVSCTAYTSMSVDLTLQEFVRLRAKRDWLVLVWYSVSAAVDITITLSLFYLLRRDRANIRKQTRRVLDRLILWTVPTGLITSMLAVTTLSIFKTTTSAFVWLLLYLVTSSMYPLMMIVLLNARAMLRSISEEKSEAFKMGDMSFQSTTAQSTHIAFENPNATRTDETPSSLSTKPTDDPEDPSKQISLV